MTPKLIQTVPADERTLAGLAYLLGLVPALIIWIFKMDDSPRVRFHAIQAGLFDGFVWLTATLLVMLSFLTLFILMIAIWLGTNIVADLLAPETPLVYVVLTVLLMLLTSSGIGLAAVLLLCLNLVDLVAALFLFSGHNWRYPVIASWAEKLSHWTPV